MVGIQLYVYIHLANGMNLYKSLLVNKVNAAIIHVVVGKFVPLAMIVCIPTLIATN